MKQWKEKQELNSRTQHVPLHIQTTIEQQLQLQILTGCVPVPSWWNFASHQKSSYRAIDATSSPNTSSGTQNSSNPIKFPFRRDFFPKQKKKKARWKRRKPANYIEDLSPTPLPTINKKNRWTQQVYLKQLFKTTYLESVFLLECCV